MQSTSFVRQTSLLMRGTAACLLSAALLSGCGSSSPAALPVVPVPEVPVAPPDLGRSLSSYLHDLSPKMEGVVVADIAWEHYNIPTSDGTVLDGWVKRPPGEVGQPLVLVFSPYYGGGDPSLSLALGTPSDGFAALIPYGYAVGFVSVGGTGNSGGCFRNGGAIERQQLYDASEYMASQTWSNGAVAPIGVSYDGTTANELFVSAPPSIKTVVPMEGISDYYRYNYNNGLLRSGNGAFTTYYYPIVGLSPAGLEGGVGPTEPMSYVTELAGEPCADQLAIQQESVHGVATADKTPYWYERDAITLVEDSLDQKRPPMLFIEGYQDANVDPLMANGYLEAVKKTGVPLHVLFGQWVHAYPQSTSGAACKALAPCRGDFFETYLLAWFDQYLKGRDTGILDAPAMQTQADDGIWRHEESWPPPQVTTATLHLSSDGKLVAAATSGSASYTDITGDNSEPTPLTEGTALEYLSEPLTAPLRLTGMPRFESVMTASGQRANVVATLLERKADGTQRYLNFAVLNLNHAATLDASDMDITGKALPVAINFFPQDNVVAAGSTLVLHIAGLVPTEHTTAGDSGNLLNGGPNIEPIGIGADVELDLASSTLTLPVNAGDRIETLSWLTP